MKTYFDELRSLQVHRRYEPKRNPNTDLKYFLLIPWTPQSAPYNDDLILLAVAKNSDEFYVAIRDTKTKKEYVEKVLLAVSGDTIRANPVTIDDDYEWQTAFEFFAKMGIIQNRQSKWRWSK